MCVAGGSEQHGFVRTQVFVGENSCSQDKGQKGWKVNVRSRGGMDIVQVDSRYHRVPIFLFNAELHLVPQRMANQSKDPPPVACPKHPKTLEQKGCY